jgi:O-antigen biosynthesis protein
VSAFAAGVRSVWNRARRKGPRLLAQSALARAAERFGVDELRFPLRDEDVWDSGRALPAPEASMRGLQGARIAWFVVPPGVGSGGHTTFFRMMEAARRAGAQNTLVLYDRYRGDRATHVQRLREGWPWLVCDIADADDDLSGADAAVASSWESAHVVASRTAGRAVARLYFVQDYEPYFWPRGVTAALAEDTYRFGMTNIALGAMVAEALDREAGAPARTVPFGVDRAGYRVSYPASGREGIAFFAKTGNDRRGYRLGLLALREFQRRRPDVPIHVYGDRITEQGLRVTNHGFLGREGLNRLYNSVRAGLVLSFTNVSLVPFELAAAGAIPVMNEHRDARAVFDNPHAVWATATATGLADGLECALDAPDVLTAQVSTWPTPTWDETGAAFVAALESALRADDTCSPEARGTRAELPS